MSPNTRKWMIGAALATALASAHAQEGNSDTDLAKKLSNPIAALISVPFQFNYDQNIGPADDGHKTYVNIQPVIPHPISEDWNLITRVIVPVVDQSDIFPGAGSQFGLGDTTASLFFSPKKPSASGWIWGVGPAFYIPTSTDDLLGAKKWGLGPTAVLLKQSHGWTYGALVNHIWSVASVHGNNDNRPDISSTFIQPFLSYTTKTAWTYGGNFESTYDWKAHQWAVPLNVSVSKLTRIGSMPVSIGGGAGYWLQHSDNGAKEWRVRFVVTLLFPQ
jgi:hypothetical protein